MMSFGPVPSRRLGKSLGVNNIISPKTCSYGCIYCQVGKKKQHYAKIIWRGGECLSCKTRCPRGNVPCYIIQALRGLSIEKSFFVESEQGRKQLAIKRTVGDHILKYGYCVYIDEVDLEMYPEQGPVGNWVRENRGSILERL